MRERAARVRSAGPAILQAAGAAGVAWILAGLIPGHDNPQSVATVSRRIGPTKP